MGASTDSTEAFERGRIWFVVGQVWLAAGVIGTGWPSAVCVLLGVAWYVGSLVLDHREQKRGY